jgi:hypothetical protein
LLLHCLWAGVLEHVSADMPPGFVQNGRKAPLRLALRIEKFVLADFMLLASGHGVSVKLSN